MLFGSPSRYTNPRQSGRDSSRQRIFSLGIFFVLVVAVVAISPSLVRFFQSSQPDPSIIRPAPEPLEEGEHLIDLTNLDDLIGTKFHPDKGVNGL